MRVGDVLWVADEEEVPCDLLCLFCSLRDRVCFIQTTNLGAHPSLRTMLRHCKPSMTWRLTSSLTPLAVHYGLPLQTARPTSRYGAPCSRRATAAAPGRRRM